MASVIAHEYPSPYVRLLVYGLAAAVSASRVDARQHFPSDVLIGSAIGWLSGEEVYRRHHDPAVGGGDWETYAESHDESPARHSGANWISLRGTRQLDLSRDRAAGSAGLHSFAVSWTCVRGRESNAHIWSRRPGDQD